MSEYSSILNFSSSSGTSQADWKNTLKEHESVPVRVYQTYLDRHIGLALIY